MRDSWGRRFGFEEGQRQQKRAHAPQRAIGAWIVLIGVAWVWLISINTLVSLPLGAEEPNWEALLQRPILPRHIPESEVQAYCAQRVARLPEFASREAWETYAENLRGEILREVVLRGEAATWQKFPVHVEWFSDLPGGESYRVRRLRYEALPGLWIPALMYEPRSLSGKVPVILNVNGHDGDGKAADYKQRRCIHLAQQGMIALNVEWLGMGELRTRGFQHGRMNQLDLCGTSGLAPFFLAMQRGLDVLLEHPHADKQRVAVAGLSGGGWQTILLSSLDTRVTLANPVAGYSSFLTRVRHHSDLGDSEQTPVDLAARADYTHLTALLSPRRALLTYNLRDNCCFASDHALPPLLAAAQPIYTLSGVPERLTSHVNVDPGTHNFELDNRKALYRAIRQHFFESNGDSEGVKSAPFSTEEQIRDEEVLTVDELRVGVPEDQADFTRLARELASRLPREANRPKEASAWPAWYSRQAEVLRETVRWPQRGAVVGRRVATDWAGAVEVTYWKLAMGGEWTLPAVEFSPPNARGCVVLVGDGGRSILAAQVARWLADEYRVVAVDPFYWGESELGRRAYLFALLVSSVGERPLGIQASQLEGVLEWAGQRHPDLPMGLSAVGPRATLAALVTGALIAESGRTSGENGPGAPPDSDQSEANGTGNQAPGHPRGKLDFLELDGLLGSLHEVLERDMSFEEAPELFCFGLLRDFDIRQLVTLRGTCDIRVINPSSRVQTELGNLLDRNP